MIAFNCPTCGKHHAAKDKHEGKRYRCSECATLIQIPARQRGTSATFPESGAATAPNKTVTERDLRPRPRMVAIAGAVAFAFAVVVAVALWATGSSSQPPNRE